MGTTSSKPMYYMRIEGNPFIIRFKTMICNFSQYPLVRIEGNPFIIRFKT